MATLQELITDAFVLRAQLIERNEYTVEEVKYLLDRSKTEDDGFESVKTVALTLLLNLIQNP